MRNPLRVLLPALNALLLLAAAGPAAARQAPNPPVAMMALHSDRSIDVARCVLACFDLVRSHSTPAYRTLDTPRNVTLVYNSRTAYPRPYVMVNAQAAASGPLPDMLSIEVDVHGVPVNPIDGSGAVYYTYADATRPWALLAFQFDGSGYATGRHPVTVRIRAWSGGVASAATTLNTHVLIVNGSSSPFGAGWDIAGLQRLHISGSNAVITTGDGSAVHFAWSGSAWQAPDGEASTLVAISGSQYERRFLDGSFVRFDAAGRIIRAQDRFGNATLVSWGASGPTAITEPMGTAPATPI
jgi:hypothetical protein